jgi:glycosyltransferase involved in cell wall biosynthesis
MVTLESDRAAPLHVCHVVLSLGVGGLERVILDLAREGPSRGQGVSILCVERPGALAPAAESLGVPIACAGKTPGFRPDVVPRITTLLRRIRPDVVHTHQIGALLYAGPAARRARVPLTVHTEHGKHYAGRWRMRLIGRMAGRYARRYFCVSADIVREVRDHRLVPRAKLALIPNGIDTQRFAAPADGSLVRREAGVLPGAFVVGTVGRLATVKRQDVLLRGFARLTAGGVAAHLLLVGDGPKREDLQVLAARLGVAGRVTFAGYTDRPERFLAAMDAFALTSDSEGMPLSVLEAWAAGKPVVASRVGGVPELIADGRTGLLFPAGDDAALSDRLRWLVHNRSLACALGEAGRSLVQDRFDTRVMADAYEQHYRELMPDHLSVGCARTGSER